MYVGYKFTDDGQEFEVIAINGESCEIKKPSGEIFTLKRETLEYLKFVKSIMGAEIWD